MCSDVFELEHPVNDGGFAIQPEAVQQMPLEMLQAAKDIPAQGPFSCQCPGIAAKPWLCVACPSFIATDERRQELMPLYEAWLSHLCNEIQREKRDV
jgi:hypothetical protein